MPFWTLGGWWPYVSDIVCIMYDGILSAKAAFELCVYEGNAYLILHYIHIGPGFKFSHRF